MSFSFLILYSTKTEMLNFLCLLRWASQNSVSFSDAVNKLNKTKPNTFQTTRLLEIINGHLLSQICHIFAVNL